MHLMYNICDVLCWLGTLETRLSFSNYKSEVSKQQKPSILSSFTVQYSHYLTNSCHTDNTNMVRKQKVSCEHNPVGGNTRRLNQTVVRIRQSDQMWTLIIKCFCGLIGRPWLPAIKYRPAALELPETGGIDSHRHRHFLSISHSIFLFIHFTSFCVLQPILFFIIPFHI